MPTRAVSGGLRPDRHLPVNGSFESYDDAISWLVDHYNLERRLGAPGLEPPSLDRMSALMGLLGDPQSSIPALHITGTNGKGSTSRMIVELLGALGLDAGSYRSPHITRVNDRISVANAPLSDDDFAAALAEVAVVEQFVTERVGEAPNYFEVLCAAAYNWFAATAVDVNVIEVGMGGRWDATNVIEAEVAVVTNVGPDHLEIIGPTLADVAREKAGIVSPGSHVICGETDPALVDIVRAAGGRELWVRGQDFDILADRLAVGGRVVDLFTPYGRHEEVFIPVHGRHQSANLVAAIAAVEAFFGRRLEDEVVTAALAPLTLPARFEVMGRHPLVIVDGAHNPTGAAAASETLFEDFAGPERPVLVMGCNRPHDPAAFLSAIGAARFAAVVATAADWPRAVPVEEVAAAATQSGARTESAPRVADAVDLAVEIAGVEGVVLVAGSLYVAAEARVHLQG
jgi:dihydrofolate synthase/folylpolyglutamate synthase